jgi:hypothetical protein
MAQELGRLTVSHLECKKLACALLFRGGQSLHRLYTQRSLGKFFWWRGDDVHLRSVSVVQLRDVVELRSLFADAGQGELCLNLNEPHCWPLGIERLKPHGNSGYLRWLLAVRWLHHIGVTHVVSTTRMFLWGLKRSGFAVGSGCVAAMKNEDTLATWLR